MEQCDEVTALDRRVVLKTWQGWMTRYQIPPKGGACDHSPVARLHRVPGCYNGLKALNAYQQQYAGSYLILIDEVLVGLRCRSDCMPAIYHHEIALLVTPEDFGWSFGSQGPGRQWLFHGGFAFARPPEPLEGSV